MNTTFLSSRLASAIDGTRHQATDASVWVAALLETAMVYPLLWAAACAGTAALTLWWFLCGKYRVFRAVALILFGLFIFLAALPWLPTLHQPVQDAHPGLSASDTAPLNIDDKSTTHHATEMPAPPPPSPLAHRLASTGPDVVEPTGYPAVVGSNPLLPLRLDKPLQHTPTLQIPANELSSTQNLLLIATPHGMLDADMTALVADALRLEGVSVLADWIIGGAVMPDTWRSWFQGQFRTDWILMGMSHDAMPGLWIGEVTYSSVEAGNPIRTHLMSLELELRHWRDAGSPVLDAMTISCRGVGFNRAQARQDMMKQFPQAWQQARTQHQQIEGASP